MQEIAFGIIISLIFISLLILFCGILIKVFIDKNKKYAQDLFQKDLDFQKTITKIVLETQEQTFANISQELHDDAGQQLTFINFQLENLKLDLPNLSSEIEPISGSIHKLSNTIRNLSHSLNNFSLTQVDFISFLQNEIQTMRKNYKININLSIETKIEKKFSDEEKIVLYRIFQEAINNAMKHSKCKEIFIHLISNSKFEMQISDNGIGFHQSEPKTHSTLGLQNMTNRAEMIGYTTEIISKNSYGTKLIIKEK